MACLMEYLSETPVAPLQKDLVEVREAGGKFGLMGLHNHLDWDYSFRSAWPGLVLLDLRNWKQQKSNPIRGGGGGV